MKFRVVASVIVIAVFAFLGTGTGGSDGEQKEPTAKKNPTAPKAPDIPVPAKQEAFSQAVTKFYQPYNEAPNDLKKSVLRTNRKSEIKTVLGSARSFKEWIGKINTLQTTGDGKAVLSIKLLGSGVQLKTWNNGLSDIGDDTLIKQSSSLFATIAELKVGSRVKISGSFIKSTQDYVRESSMSEHGSMTDPEFIVKFKSVSAL